MTNKQESTIGTVRAKLTLDVVYTLNGVHSGELLDNLRKLCERAIGEGLLTGTTEAVVDEYSMDVQQVESDLDEDQLAQFMASRIENADIAMEDIPIRLARYGLMNPAAFINEMSERMEMQASGESNQG